MMAAQRSDWLTSIIKNGRWYFVSSVASKSLALVSLKIVTHGLSPAEFGSLNTLIALTQALPIFLSIYLDTAIGRIYHDYADSKEMLSRLFSTIYWFVVVWGTGVVVVFSIYVAHFALFDDNIDVSLLWIASIPMLLLQLSQMGIVYMRQSFQAKQVTMIEAGGAFAGVIATYILVTILKEGVLGRLIAIGLASAFGFLLVTIHFWRAGLLRFRFSPAMLRACLIYSIPLTPTLAAGWIAGNSDRLIISKYTDLESVGLYSLAASIASLLYIVQDAVTQVTSVTSQSGMIRNREQTLKMVSELSYLLWVVMLFVNFGVMAYSELLVRIFSGDRYMGAAALIGVCGFTYVISPQVRVLSDLIAYNKRTWVLSSGAIIMALCSLVINFYFVPQFGYEAAPFALVGATFAQAAWLYFWVYRMEKLHLPWLKAIGALVIFAIFFEINRQIPWVGLTSMAAKAIPTLAYGVITFYLASASLRILRGFTDRAA